MVRDHVSALETIIELGFHRVLTSGLDSTCLEGLPVIRELVEQVRNVIFSLKNNHEIKVCSCFFRGKEGLFLCQVC